MYALLAAKRKATMDTTSTKDHLVGVLLDTIHYVSVFYVCTMNLGSGRSLYYFAYSYIGNLSNFIHFAIFPN